MSYPRNAVSPIRIGVGPVVKQSNGEVQTSGCLVAVRPEGGAESAGGGAISYGSTTGIVYYTPLQAETDYVGFVVVAHKAGCFPVEKTVVTGPSAGSGPLAVTLTVTDGVDPIEGAVVRVVSGGDDFTSDTDVNGAAVFSLNALTYTVTITRTGYSFVPAPIVVTVDATFPLVMTVNSVPTPTAPDTAVGVVALTYLPGDPEDGTASVLMTKAPPCPATGSTGVFYTGEVWTRSDGIFDGLHHGATYMAWRGSSRENAVTFKVPSVDNLLITSAIGID